MGHTGYPAISIAREAADAFVTWLSYTGIVGMEHGNSVKGKHGERAAIDAYVEADRWG